MNVIEVVDVPAGASEDEARRLLNRPCEANRYMLVQVFLLPNGHTRAFYRLVARAYDLNPGERSELQGFQGNRDGMESAACALIQANMNMSLRQLVRVLEDSGIKRGKSWVSEVRMKQREAGTTLHD
jgi:hypothetical protein